MDISGKYEILENCRIYMVGTEIIIVQFFLTFWCESFTKTLVEAWS